MDLLDFQAESLYFDEPCPPEVDDALQCAALDYGRQTAEPNLLRAYFLAPDNLTVLVALYRYFYYQHRHRDALTVAERLTVIVGRRLGLRADWRRMDMDDLAGAVRVSMGLTRFLLFAIKAMGVLKLRMGDPSGAVECLAKVRELDSANRLGTGPLLQMARRAQFDAEPLAAGAA